MADLLSDVSGFIASHREWAGLLTGLLCFVICLAIVGIVIPAPPLMIALGGLIASGMIDWLPVVGGAVVGGALGFLASYVIGRWLGPSFVHRWPLRTRRRRVARAKLLFRRYASIGVFASRFFGPLRVTIPLFAGMIGMKQHRFHVANILSALVWAPALMAPGWLAAKALEEIENLAEAQILSVTFAVLFLVFLAAAIAFRLQRRRVHRRRKAAGAGLF